MHSRIARTMPGRGRFANLKPRAAAKRANESDEWYTPISLIRALGEFDLDPACGPSCPNRTAKRRYATRGLERQWEGRVWLNPPFSYAPPWVDKMIAHGNGVMLVFARADAVWFQRACEAARGVYLLRGRLEFERPQGRTGHCPIGCVLFGFGAANRRAIQNCAWPGVWLTRP